MWKSIIAAAKEAAPAPTAPGPVEGAEQAPAATGGGGFGSLLPMFIAFIAIMYFLMIRPQQKREKERRQMLASLSKGDKVVTSGGMCGTIVSISENNVVLKVDDNVSLEFLRSAVSQVTSRKTGRNGARGEAKK